MPRVLKAKLAEQAEQQTQDRVAAIASKITDAFASVSKTDTLRDDAEHAFDQAREASGGARRQALTSLAAISHREQWSADETDKAVTAAVSSWEKSHNIEMKKSSLRTFVSDIRRACAPKAREHVAAYFKLADEAFVSSPETMSDAFKRRDHAANAMLVAAGEDGHLPFQTPGDVLDFARTRANNGPTAGSAFARIKTMRAALDEFVRVFPNTDLGIALASLNKIPDAKALSQSRANALKTQSANVKVRESAAPAPAPVQPAVDFDDLVNQVAGLTQMVAMLKRK